MFGWQRAGRSMVKHRYEGQYFTSTGIGNHKCSCGFFSPHLDEITAHGRQVFRESDMEKPAYDPLVSAVSDAEEAA